MEEGKKEVPNNGNSSNSVQVESDLEISTSEEVPQEEMKENNQSDEKNEEYREDKSTSDSQQEQQEERKPRRKMVRTFAIKEDSFEKRESKPLRNSMILLRPSSMDLVMEEDFEVEQKAPEMMEVKAQEVLEEVLEEVHDYSMIFESPEGSEKKVEGDDDISAEKSETMEVGRENVHVSKKHLKRILLHEDGLLHVQDSQRSLLPEIEGQKLEGTDFLSETRQKDWDWDWAVPLGGIALAAICGYLIFRSKPTFL